MRWNGRQLSALDCQQQKKHKCLSQIEPQLKVKRLLPGNINFCFFQTTPLGIKNLLLYALLLRAIIRGRRRERELLFIALHLAMLTLKKRGSLAKKNKTVQETGQLQYRAITLISNEYTKKVISGV